VTAVEVRLANARSEWQLAREGELDTLGGGRTPALARAHVDAAE